MGGPFSTIQHDRRKCLRHFTTEKNQIMQSGRRTPTIVTTCYITQCCNKAVTIRINISATQVLKLSQRCNRGFRFSEENTLPRNVGARLFSDVASLRKPQHLRCICTYKYKISGELRDTEDARSVLV
jgi:hypothetical protein